MIRFLSALLALAALALPAAASAREPAFQPTRFSVTVEGEGPDDHPDSGPDDRAARLGRVGALARRPLPGPPCPDRRLCRRSGRRQCRGSDPRRRGRRASPLYRRQPAAAPEAGRPFDRRAARPDAGRASPRRRRAGADRRRAALLRPAVRAECDRGDGHAERRGPPGHHPRHERRSLARATAGDRSPR